MNISEKNVPNPLHVAAQNGDIKILLLLLDNGADPTLKSSEGSSVLHFAASSLLIFKKLYNEVPNDIYLVNDNLTSILHEAAKCKNSALVKFLINKGVELDTLDIDGFTPLHFACKNGSFKIAKLLAENGVELNTKNNKGLAPLDFAVNQNDYSITQFLIESGAEVSYDLFSTDQRISKLLEDERFASLLLNKKVDKLVLLEIFRQNFLEIIESGMVEIVKENEVKALVNKVKQKLFNCKDINTLQNKISNLLKNLEIISKQEGISFEELSPFSNLKVPSLKILAANKVSKIPIEKDFNYKSWITSVKQNDKNLQSFKIIKELNQWVDDCCSIGIKNLGETSSEFYVEEN